MHTNKTTIYFQPEFSANKLGLKRTCSKEIRNRNEATPSNEVHQQNGWKAKSWKELFDLFVLPFWIGYFLY